MSPRPRRLDRYEPRVTLYESGMGHLELGRVARSAGDYEAARKAFDAARRAFNESMSMGASTRLRETEEEIAALAEIQAPTLRTGGVR